MDHDFINFINNLNSKCLSVCPKYARKIIPIKIKKLLMRPEMAFG
jgi:hypothetical protein